MTPSDACFDLAKQGGTAEAITLFTLIFSREQEEAAQTSRGFGVILAMKKTMCYEEERQEGTRWIYIPVNPAEPVASRAKHFLIIIERTAT